ncbi:MAG: NAD(P)-dependent oxidoreductase [Bacillota bacterium]|nr:NAD(P)-dependent oxidoreductase [Bacillota bacterium]
MKKIVVTGGSGRLGKWVVKEFVEQGWEVLNVDIKQPQKSLCRTVVADLKNLGEVYGVLAGAQGVVHLAAIPVAYSNPNEVVFQNNVMASYNILEASAGLGINKIVLASSESSYGFCFAEHDIAPQYVPLDEDHPQLPQDSYGLSKVVAEEMGAAFHRRTGMQVVSLRLGNVITPEMYADFPGIVNDPDKKIRNLWNYIDARDAASACRCAIEAEGLGAVNLNITANDNAMNIKSRELMRHAFPEVKDFRALLEGYETLIANDKARKLLSWEPVHYWRDYVK